MKIYVLKVSRKRMKQNVKKTELIGKTKTRDFRVVHERDGKTVHLHASNIKTAYRTAKRLIRAGFAPVVWEYTEKHKRKHEININNNLMGGKIHRAQLIK